MNNPTPRNPGGRAGRWLRGLDAAARRAARFALALSFAAWAIVGVAPPAAATSTSFAAGTLVIPMDTAYQDYGMWKAYGLVIKLLASGVPVHWGIGNPKTPDAFNGVDFTASTRDKYTLAVIGSPYSYRGGPFIIDQANVAAANPIINAWRTANANQPAIHEATAPFTANIDMVLRTAPRIALEAVNASIAIAYFNAAGITDSNGNPWSTTSPNVLNVGLLACNNAALLATGNCPTAAIGDGALFRGGPCGGRNYDIFITPHNGGYAYSTTDPTNVGTQAYAELDYFAGNGGGWIAMCHSILSNENNIAALYALSPGPVRSLFTSSSPGGFLTTNGFSTISNASGTWTVDPNAVDLPIAQAVPTSVANGLPGGSVQNWPHTGQPGAPSYWGETERVAYFAAGALQYDWGLNGVYHNGSGRGKITFLGGHSYSTALPYSANFEAPYLRFFYNALFFNGSAVASMGLVASTSAVAQGNTTAVQFAFKNTSASPAQNVGATGGVTVTLQSGITYVSTTGPQPSSVTVNGDGTTTVVWGPLGTIAAGATAFTINTSVFFATTGTKPATVVAAAYSDNLQESFTNNSCTSIDVTAAPGTSLVKSPATVGPVNVGDVVTWTLAYSNPGSGNLVNPYVEDILPSAFAYVSASPAPTSIVPIAGGTKIRWTLASPLTAGGSGTITLRATVQTATGQPFTNNATLYGQDAGGNAYSGTSAATVSAATPQATLLKSVSPTGTVLPGATLTYTLRPSAPGPVLFTNLRIFDPPPLNTTYVAGSTNQGGTFGAYVPLPGVQGADSGGDPVTTMDIAAGASPFTYALGSTLTVTMTLANSNASSGSITNVTASLTPSDGVSTCVPLSAQPVASIARNASANVTFTCTTGSVGEITWDGAASGTFAGGPYSFVTATSSSVLGVTTTSGTQGSQWTGMAVDSNTAPVPASSFAAGSSPGVFAFNGGSAVWERYDVGTNAWVTSPVGLTNNLPGNTAAGAAMAYDGQGYANGYVYALQGGSAAFWRYKLSNGTTGTWAAVANAPWSVGNGGALTTLGAYLYALRGGNQPSFARYDPGANSWTTLANVPANVNAGGALATDGTYVYALRGNNTASFYRYDAAANTWTLQANFPWNANTGSAMTSVGTTLYATQANGKKGFAQFVPNASVGVWTKLAGLPGNAKAGAGLATDGTTIWATAGNNTRPFWAYTIALGTWATKASTLANINTGGALAWVPGSAAASTTTALSAPTLVTGTAGSPATIQVQMTLTSATAVTGITPTQLTVASSNANPPSATPAAGCTVSPAGGQSISAGGSLTFTWTCTNVYATGTTAGTTMGALTFSAGATGTTPATTFGTATSNSVLVTQPLTYQVTVNAGGGFNQVTNQALLSDDGAFASGIGSNVVTTPVQQPAAVTVVKSVSPTGQVDVGTNLVYTIAVQNTTANPTANVLVTDVVPTGTTYVSCATTAGTCSSSGTSPGSSVSFNLGNIGAYGAATLTMTVTTTAPAAAGLSTVSNTAAYSLNSGGGTSTNTVSNTVLARPAVTIAKAESVIPAANGNGAIAPSSAITYTMTVTNPAGAVPATSVVATDIVPAGTTYIAASCTVTGGTINNCSSSGTAAGSTVTFNIGSLAANSTATLTFQVLVVNPANDGDSIVNTASVSAATNIAGSTYTAVSNLVSYLVAAAPVIAVGKSASPASGSNVAIGDTITYTLTVKNTGNANSNSAYVNDAIPVGTTYVANSTTLNGVAVTELTPGVPPVAGGMKVYSPCCADGGGDGGTLVSENAPGGTANDAVVTFQVTVDSASPVTAITNQATAASATTTPASSNTTTHNIRADLGVAKSGPGTVSSGASVSYSLLVSNAGPSSAAGALVKDPAVSYYSVDSVTCSVTSGGAVCPASLTVAGLQGSGLVIPTFPKNSSLTFTVTGYADVVNTTVDIVNVATVSPPAGVADPNAGNDSSTATTHVTGNPTIAIVSGVRAYVENGTPWLEWETASEVRSAGFNLLRRDAARGGYVRLNPALLPSLVGARRGGVYRFPDPAAVAGGTYTYGIEEIEVTGTVRRYGPYTVTYGARGSAAASLAKRFSADVRRDAGPAGGGFERAARLADGRAAPVADARVTRLAATAATAADATATTVPDATQLRIFVEDEGIYAVRTDQIAALLGKPAQQIRTAIANERLRLQSKGRDVSWRADPVGDRILFYGQGPQGADAVYTRRNVYVLDQRAGPTMPVVAGAGPKPASGNASFVSRAHAEERRLPLASVATDPDADFWYWNYAYLNVTGMGEKIPFTVPAPAATGVGTATIRAYLQGASDLAAGNDHRAHLWVNGREVGALAWDGIAPAVLTASFDASLLRTDATANVVEVQGELVAGVPYSVFWIKGFDVDYARAYRAANDQLRLRGSGNPVVTVRGFSDSAVAVLDVSDALAPRWVAAATVTSEANGAAVSFVPATPATDYFVAIPKAPAALQGAAAPGLRAKGSGAVYLALAPSALRDGASALADYRGGKLVDLQEIYDDFNGGVANPNAIRDFLAFGAQNWKTPPRFVALVGKGTYDPKDYLGLHTSLFPVLMTPTPQGLFASDNRYADFDGDGVPDLAIGRIPALANADVTSYVAKLRAYEAKGRAPANQALVVADNPDDGGDFTADAGAVASLLQSRGFSTTTAFLEGSTPEAVRAQMVAALNSPAGVGLLNYVGHGANNQLADENLLSNNPGDATLAALYNPGNRLPIFTAYSCMVGDGSNPGFDSLAESLLWRNQGGVVASFVPSALSDDAHAHVLNGSMIQALTGTLPGAGATLGEAAAAALADFARKGGPLHLRATYSVVGDPALRVQR